jgi:integrase
MVKFSGLSDSKPFVRVENDDGRLRLRFTHAGKRYAIALSLPDSKVNRTVAQMKARMIEGDIATGNFDSTLAKYKPPRGSPNKVGRPTVPQLFGEFMEAQKKDKGLQVGSIGRYSATLKHLQDFFGVDVLAQNLTARDVEGFVSYLKKRKCSNGTIKHYLILARACWEWSETKQLLEFTLNPWDDPVKSLKVAPKQKVKPFTREEVAAIIAGFQGDEYYSHYTDFVKFLFGTGCRFGEAVGLRWRHISDDCTTIWIGESISRGVEKTTKTGKDRTIILTPKVTAMLQARRLPDCKPDDLVFTARNGELISDRVFRPGAWRVILAKLAIAYRKPYSTRHTAISHTLAGGANPLAVAEATGHDPTVLFKHYASVIQRSPVMFEF